MTLSVAKAHVWLVACATLVTGLTIVSTVEAGDSSVSDSTRGRSLVVLLVAEDDVDRELELRFLNALKLTLESVPLASQDMRSSGFSNRSLADQLELIRPLFETHDALAVCWIIASESNRLVMHMVALSTGQAMVRLVEAHPTAGFESDLALHARELLGGAFLFHELPATDEEPIAAVIEEVLETSYSPAPIESGTMFAFDALGAADGGIQGHVGYTASFGGMVRLSILPTEILALRMVLGLQACGRDLAKDVHLSSMAVAPGVQAALLFSSGRVRLGPALRVEAVWNVNQFDVAGSQLSMSKNSTQSFSFWRPRIVADAEVHVSLAGPLRLIVTGGAGWSPLQETHSRFSNGEKVFATPFWHWEAAVGLGVDLTSRGE